MANPLTRREYQAALFDQDRSIDEQFACWKQKPGGRRILQMAYALTAPYAARFERTGKRVSVKLVWELLRYHIDAICARRGDMRLEPVDGFALNNCFTSPLARHILAHKPEWEGLFETRKLHDE